MRLRPKLDFNRQILITQNWMQKCEIVLVKFDGRSWSNLEQGDTFAGTVYAFTLHDVVENHQQREIMLTMPFFLPSWLWQDVWGWWKDWNHWSQENRYMTIMIGSYWIQLGNVDLCSTSNCAITDHISPTSNYTLYLRFPSELEKRKSINLWISRMLFPSQADFTKTMSVGFTECPAR